MSFVSLPKTKFLTFNFSNSVIAPYAKMSADSVENTKGNSITKRFREEMSVAFQHEIDHLNGIIYIDKIDKKDPYKNIDNLRAI